MNIELKLEDFDIEWVESTERLSELAESWKNFKYLAIDTEFERRTTFFARLALVQLFDGEKIVLIDPLSVDCPQSLKDVLENPSITKIFHSCKEDLEVLYTSWNCQLKGLFDTQVAFSFLTGELSIGYAKLVELFYSIPVDKKETTSNWIKRPLTPQQKEYASKDVLYLIEVYLHQLKEFENREVFTFFTQECEELCSNAIDSVDAVSDYRDAKDVWRLNEKQAGLFKCLFDWREKTARQLDRTKNHIIKDHELVELSIIAPESKNQIKQLKDLHPRSLRLYSDLWLEIVKEWNLGGAPTQDIVLNPRDIKGLKEESNRLEKQVKNIAKENELNPTFLLSKRVIRKLAQSLITNQSKPSQWKGWRKKLLENSILKLAISRSE
ncbi:MAG: ribonuclease D [Polaribacter sp.]|jgi:ribonuclease D